MNQSGASVALTSVNGADLWRKPWPMIARLVFLDARLEYFRRPVEFVTEVVEALSSMDALGHGFQGRGRIIGLDDSHSPPSGSSSALHHLLDRAQSRQGYVSTCKWRQQRNHKYPDRQDPAEFADASFGFAGRKEDKVSDRDEHRGGYQTEKETHWYIPQRAQKSMPLAFRGTLSRASFNSVTPVRSEGGLNGSSMATAMS